MTPTLQDVATEVGRLAQAFAHLNVACHDQYAQRPGSPTCLEREAARPLSTVEQLLGYVHRPWYAYQPDKLCAACAARWHLALARDLLRHLHQPRIKTGKAGGTRRKEGVA